MIIVKTYTTDHSSSYDIEVEHGTATKFSANADGSLSVFDRSQEIVAIYAKGEWKSVSKKL